MVEEQVQLSWRVLFALYLWCPRTPDRKSSLEEHQRQMLLHHWYEGRAYCTGIEALPPEVYEEFRKRHS